MIDAEHICSEVDNLFIFNFFRRCLIVKHRHAVQLLEVGGHVCQHGVDRAAQAAGAAR